METSETFISAEGREWEQSGPGLYRQILGYSDDIMSVRVRFDGDGIARMHSHPHTQTSSIISGRFVFTVDGVSRTVSAGDGVLILPGLMHECVCLEPGIIIDTFSPMRKDFLK